MTKDKEPIDFFDAEGNRIGTLDTTAPKNEFNPDWDQMAILVEQSQEQAAKIEQLEKQLAERSAEYLAAHITYDNGYEAGRQDEREECAKLVDFILKEGGGTWGDAIRARGNT